MFLHIRLLQGNIFWYSCYTLYVLWCNVMRAILSESINEWFQAETETDSLGLIFSLCLFFYFTVSGQIPNTAAVRQLQVRKILGAIVWALTALRNHADKLNQGILGKIKFQVLSRPQTSPPLLYQELKSNIGSRAQHNLIFLGSSSVKDSSRELVYL